MAVLSNANLVRYSRRLFYVGGVIAISVLLTLLIFLLTGVGRAELKKGEVAPDTLRSPKTTVYRSDLKTKEARNAQSAKVQTVYLDKTAFVREQQRRIDSLISQIDDVRNSDNTQSEKIDTLRSLKPVNLGQHDSEIVFATPDQRWQQMGSALARALSSLQSLTISAPISSDQYDQLNAAIEKESAPLGLTPDQLGTAKSIAHKLLIPNKVVDENQTNALKDQARDQVGPVLISIQRGEVLTLKGQVIDSFALEKLEAVGLAKPTFSPQDLLGIFALCLSIVGVIGLYFHYFIRDINRRRQFLLIGAFLLVIAFACILILPIKPTAAYAFPAPAVGILVALTIDVETGLLAAVATSLLVGYLAGQSFEIALVQILASVAGVLLSRSITRLNSFAIVALGIAFAIFVPSAGFLLISGDLSLRLLGAIAIGAAINGIISALMVIGGAALISRFFGFVTFIQLLELENPSQPLLRQLILKAPGTYQHSLIIGNMAESAAQAIGANALLVRVGAYYHDIGKINDPSWFTENQHGVNPHDRLNDPALSAKKIIAHVTDGVRLAKQNHLPDEIVDFITSHHGTMKVEYFLHQAKKKKTNIDEAQFTYPGPKPQTREEAIMMLADGIEARARSLTEHNPGTLKETVEFIVNQRRSQGQLDESGITAQEVTQVGEAFISILTSVYQQRIKYPGQI